MKESDRKLGLGRDITRRDFIHDVSLTALGLSLSGLSLTPAQAAAAAGEVYPPTLNGLRGSHPGSYEVAHALAREGRRFSDPQDLDEDYDLIVVGGGLSGLAAAYFHRKLHGPDARILVLDNHDDFGGHARRNEFHQGGPMRLAWGGTVNLEYPLYSDVARGLLDDLGIDIPRLLEDFSFGWGEEDVPGLQVATWFDAATYGRDVLLPGVRFSSIEPTRLAGRVGDMPISEPGRAALSAFLLSTTDVLADLSPDEKEAYLQRTSYSDFLRQWFAMPDDAIQLFRKAPSGYWGLPAEKLSVAECLQTALPGSHVLGGFGQHEPGQRHSPVAMFPDGNSSIARLLVRALTPDAFPGMAADADPFDIVTARLDYGRLDQPAAARIRLDATVVKVENRAQDKAVAVSYVKDGKLCRVTARSSVLACNNRIIPRLCPDLPQAQQRALEQCIRRPLLVANVLLRNGQALQRVGIRSAYLPGSMLGSVNLVTGVNVGAYRPPWRPEDPCVLQFYAAWIAPGSEDLGIVQQHQAARGQMLSMPFEDFEREVRTLLNGMLGSGGFDAAADILAITVNRWPHGYARDHIDLEDPAWNADPPPNVVGRQRFGNIAIANSDAGADAFTHTAFDQAWRAVNELADHAKA